MAFSTGDSKETAAAALVPAPRSRQNGKRRQEIVDAAAEVFRRKGYSDASIQDIADEVGILGGSLYHHIDAKEDLLYEVLASVYELAQRDIDRVRALEGLGPVEKLRLYIREHVVFNATHTTKIATYYHDFELLGPERKPLIAEQRRRFESFITELILAAQDAGQIDRGIDAKMSTYLILGAMNWIYTWYRVDGKFSPEELGDLAVMMLVDGMLERSA
ncbi:MAG TPA: TetR/AcrR family transcriptional regulator [Gaiellaceae bacterium]|jgi:AcrR family transcriptional regulator|nr:TetR/AcrR family transcriptional regulator [Gaiellaceae bacterium]